MSASLLRVSKRIAISKIGRHSGANPPITAQAEDDERSDH